MKSSVNLQIMKLKLIIVSVLVLLGFFGLLFFYPKSNNIVIWAWERPENLEFLKNEKNVKVAFYAGQINYYEKDMETRYRYQPLAIDSNTEKIAVVRIENHYSDNFNLTNEFLEKTVAFVINKCNYKEITTCQIDFDARSSEREFYKRLLTKIKKQLPYSKKLSITALVSWCNKDSWLDSLPIDEAVPMFFEMGRDENIIKGDIVSQSFMKSSLCRKSIGISVNEYMPKKEYLNRKDIYIFNNKSWTKEDCNFIVQKINKNMD
jgi:hypothetical protein